MASGAVAMTVRGASRYPDVPHLLGDRPVTVNVKHYEKVGWRWVQPLSDDEGSIPPRKTLNMLMMICWGAGGGGDTICFFFEVI